MEVFTVLSSSFVKKVQILFVEKGMILEKDIVNAHGLVVLPKLTVLTDDLIQKLLFYNIDYIYVRDINNFYHSNDKSLVINFTDKLNAKMESKALQELRKSYTHSALAVQNAMTDIAAGHPTNLDSLFETVTASLDQSLRKSDLLLALQNIKVHDQYTFTHSLNVGLLCYLFGQWLGIKGEDLKHLTLGGCYTI